MSERERRRGAMQMIGTCIVMCGIFVMGALYVSHWLYTVYLSFAALASAACAYGVYDAAWLHPLRAQRYAVAVCHPHRDEVPITQRYQEPVVVESVVKPERVEEQAILVEDWPVRQREGVRRESIQRRR